MASRRSLPSQPRRAVLDSTAPPDSLAASRRSRSGRGTLAIATAGAVGVLTFCVPGVAHSVTHQEPILAASAAAVPSGSVDAFASRQDSTSRSRTRQAIARDAADAAADRADALADTAEAVAQTQTVAAAEARVQSLADTSARIRAEAERLANADKFFWPTKGGIASAWGMRMHPILRYKRLHGGADIGGAPGAPIYAVLDGTVTTAATGYNNGSGNNIRINHGQVNGERLETTYLHMTTLNVAPGERVKRGQLIGTVGSTGLSTAPHLHFSVYANGANSDPAPYLRRGAA